MERFFSDALGWGYFMTSDSSSSTIAAISTPMGKGAIGIIRLSGNDSITIASQLFKLSPTRVKPRHVYFNKIELTTHVILDHVLFFYLKAPHSYTGEDMIEISCHANPIILNELLTHIISLGATLAPPGEFTKRAFLNGKMDLTEAEAVATLIESKSLGSVYLSTRQLEGKFSKTIQAMKQMVVTIVRDYNACIEFEETDHLVIDISTTLKTLINLKSNIVQIIQNFSHHRYVYEGAKVVITGKTNVGKSSLFNALITKEKSIVTPYHGTTRDLIESTIHIGQFPITLIDTAGTRKSSNRVEQIGIKRTKEALRDADLILFVVNSKTSLSPSELSHYEEIKTKSHVIVMNKVDLPHVKLRSPFKSVVKTSTKNGQGIDALKKKIVSALSSRLSNIDTDMMTLNTRHIDLLKKTDHALHTAITLAKTKKEPELIVATLNDAIRYFSEITGEITTDEILNSIFDTFCVGK